MRFTLVSFVGAIQLASKDQFHGSEASLLQNLITHYDVSCFGQQCAKPVTKCRLTDQSCDERMACLDNSAGDMQATSGCFAGVHLLDMSREELKVLGCGRKQGCVETDDKSSGLLDMHLASFLDDGEAPSSFIEVSDVDDPEQSMRDTSAELERMGKASEEDEHTFEDGLKKESDTMDSSLQDDVAQFTKNLDANTDAIKQGIAHGHRGEASSLIQLASGPSPAVDELMQALSPSGTGKEGASVPLGTIMAGLDKFLEKYNTAPPSAHPSSMLEEHPMDDHTMLLALGALTGLGLGDKGSSFLESFDGADDAVQNAFLTGFKIAQQPGLLEEHAKIHDKKPASLMQAVAKKGGRVESLDQFASELDDFGKAADKQYTKMEGGMQSVLGTDPRAVAANVAADGSVSLRTED